MIAVLGLFTSVIGCLSSLSEIDEERNVAAAAISFLVYGIMLICSVSALLYSLLDVAGLL